ncbi:hypothetical protein C8Q78DRAFT_844853 [Trametes maxima]|nr:hypothetical protein C8Q78DRAFT_844853 [Trametes maxima]
MGTAACSRCPAFASRGHDPPPCSLAAILSALRESRSTPSRLRAPAPYMLGFSTLLTCGCEAPGCLQRHFPLPAARIPLVIPGRHMRRRGPLSQLLGAVESRPLGGASGLPRRCRTPPRFLPVVLALKRCLRANGVPGLLVAAGHPRSNRR